MPTYVYVLIHGEEWGESTIEGVYLNSKDAEEKTKDIMKEQKGWKLETNGEWRLGPFYIKLECHELK